MKTLVTYSTKTGNTKKVAESIAKAIDNAEIKDIAEVSNLDYDLIIVGTWIDKGTADAKALNFIKTIKNKNTAFFFTLGAYPDSDHAKKSLENIAALFDSSNEVVGQYICQGSVSYKMVEMMTKMFPEGHPHAMTEERKARIQESYSHPDNQDLLKAREYFTELKNRLEGII